MIRFAITSACSLCMILQLAAQDNWRAEQEKIIRQRIDQFVLDVNSGNAEGFVDAFSDKLYSPQVKDGIKASVTQRSEVYEIDYEIHLNDVKVDNKMAYEEGWFRSVLVPKKGGESVVQEFDFLDVWELEEDGQWRIVKAMKKERPLAEYKTSSSLSGEPAQIAGAYKTAKFPVDIKVTASDQLVLIVNNGSPIKLKKKSDLTYLLEGVAGAELRFEIGDGGFADKAIMKQATGEVVASRL